MRGHWKLVFLIIAAAVVYAGWLLFSGPAEVAHDAVQYQLSSIGQSIYEYHTLTGKWPHQVEDLDRTSLGLRLHYWKAEVANGSIVIVWHDQLNPNPASNRDIILAYHNKGTLATMGRQWVCWGDLRTEYISTRHLKAVLAETVNQGEP